MARTADAPSRPAWYAGRPGWRGEWFTVLHPPYTLWHLSYVSLGAGLAPHVDAARLAGTVAAFGLAVGVGAHALDELHGRPLGTTLPSSQLVAAAIAALVLATAIGIIGISQVGLGLAAFVACGLVLVLTYNLELFAGRLHNGFMFAAAWGAFPVVTSYYAQTGKVGVAAAIGAAFAFALSYAQRVLSTEARHLRRTAVSVVGTVVDRDGARHDVTREILLKPLERTLVALAWSACLLGTALVSARPWR